MAVAERGVQDSGSQVADLERKPLLTFRAILLMNFGFFGIQYSFGLQQTAVNPLFTFIGANPEDSRS